jgi:hypothetical protein
MHSAGALSLTFLLLGCAADVSLPPKEVPPVTLPACLGDLREEAPPTFNPGALCTEDDGALQGPGMAAVMSRTLFGLSASGAAALHPFFADLDTTSFHNASGAVAMRGDLIAGAGVVFRSPEEGGEGEAAMELAVLRRSGQLLFTHRVEAEFNGGSTSVRLVGNDRGVLAYSFESYPFVSGMEVVTVNGDRFGFMDGLMPVADPDANGYVAVRESGTTERRSYWLNPCDGELRPTEESRRSFRTTAEPLGSRLVYTDVDENTLVVESATEVTRVPMGEATGMSSFDIFDIHPSGWVLVTAKDPQSFLAVHADTHEIRAITIEIPPGLRRYDAFTAGPAPGAFDAVAGELRVTSAGDVILPLRDDEAAHLYVSRDGKDWAALGAPIGEVYSSKGVEAGGTFVHVGNAFAVTLPPWAPAPPDSDRLDFQSTQLVRPESKVSLVVDKSPPGSNANRVYHVSLDGGCLATTSISGGDISWSNAVTGEQLSFAMPKGDFTQTAFTWLSSPDVAIYSLF